jgi:elongation factor P
MYNLNEIRRGAFVEVDGSPYIVIENEFVKPGKGTPFNRVKMKNLLTQKTDEKTFKGSEKLTKANVETKEMQYLYNDGSSYNFMNQETFDQLEIPKEVLDTSVNYLLEQAVCTVMTYNGKPIGINIDNFVNLEITYTEPGVKGDTTNTPFKNATMETGFEMMVPMFCEIGDRVKVDTRDGKYVERVK